MSLMFADSPGKTLSSAGGSVQEPLNVPVGTEPGNRAALLLTATLPLAIGIGLAVFTGMWMFLAFAATSALALLVPVVAGRRQRRNLAAAVRTAVGQDRERRLRSGPSLADVSLSLGAEYGWPVADPDSSGLWLRLGQAQQDANIHMGPGACTAKVPSVGTVPVLVDVLRPMTVFSGPALLLDGMIRSLVMQLSGYPRCRSTHVIIYGRPEILPLQARYLPGVVLAATASACSRALAEGLPAGYRRGVLVLTDCPAPVGGAAALPRDALERGWHVLDFRPAEAGIPRSDVSLLDHCSTLHTSDGDVAFIADLAPEEVFGSFCRRLAALPRPPAVGNRALPQTCGLEDVLPLSVARTAERWDASARDRSLSAPLGLTAAGVRTLDLHADGPHLLVAGTTGSGKSELLRSLTLALALSHPPDRINFLFLDFKGGSGLGPLTGLVHCVGLLTDLSTGEMERTLASLRAEIRLREEALASARVPDLAGYRGTARSRELVLPHLVIVIDEFRMLVDDAPEVLRELMRLASIGRSLGIHLVMATQRPQGALTADIRANVTSSIALRVQSDMESVDIVGSKAAAAISIENPGRAFLARGTEAAEEFQAATTGLARGRAGPGGSTIKVQTTHDYLAASPASVNAPEALTPALAVLPLVEMVRDLWAARGGAPPRMPVADPLPQHIEEPPRGDAAGSASERDGCWTVTLGAMDLPHRQCLQPLAWKPATDGHLAMIGAPASGANEALELAVHRLLAHREPVHCYLLDGTGTFQGAAAHQRVGAHTGLHELRRAVRVLERLDQERTRRLNLSPGSAVPLVLAISGWGSWSSAFRSGPLAWAEDLVQDLVRDGARAGITVLVSGDRELATARFSSSLPNRLYFPAASNQDSRVSWPRMPSTAAVPLRAVAFGAVSRAGPAVCQVYKIDRARGVHGSSECHATSEPEPLPFRVEPLPPRITAPELRRLGPSRKAPGGEGAAQLSLEMLVGVGGDELSPAVLRLRRGGVVPVLGRPGSGKTNVLKVLQELNTVQRWLFPGSGPEAPASWTRVLSASRAGEVPTETVLLADDADLLSVSEQQDLAALHALGHAVVLSASYSPLLLQRVPLAMGSRTAGTALLLGPASVSDGDVFGVRFEVEPDPPPGRAVLIASGRSCAIQVACAGPQ